MSNTNKFFSLVSLLAAPFYILGAFVDLTKFIPIQLPVSALIFLCPITTAFILTKKQDKSGGAKSLLTRIFEYKKIPNRSWLFPVFFLIPTLMLLTYQIMVWFDFPLPKPNIHFIDVVIFSILFFIGAIGEEVGWTGFLTDPLQDRFGAFKAALILGIFWAIYHIIPFTQTHRTPIWIFWQCIGTVALRIIMVWLYNNTGKNLLVVIICHTTVNMSEYLFPNYGSHYDPFIFGILLIITVIAITFFWGTKTLADYKYSFTQKRSSK